MDQSVGCRQSSRLQKSARDSRAVGSVQDKLGRASVSRMANPSRGSPPERGLQARRSSAYGGAPGLPVARLAERALMPQASQKIAGARARRHHRKAEPPDAGTLAGVPETMCSVESSATPRRGGMFLGGALRGCRFAPPPVFFKFGSMSPGRGDSLFGSVCRGSHGNRCTDPQTGAKTIWGGPSRAVNPLAPRLVCALGLARLAGDPEKEIVGSVGAQFVVHHQVCWPIPFAPRP
jgi:hypothetical protein